MFLEEEKKQKKRTMTKKARKKKTNNLSPESSSETSDLSSVFLEVTGNIHFLEKVPAMDGSLTNSVSHPFNK